MAPTALGRLGCCMVLADMIKIFSKEDWIPPFADKFVFMLAPAIIMATVLLSFAVVPASPGIVVADLNIGLLFFLGMSSLGVYSVVAGRLGFQQQVFAAGQPARCRPDAQLRSLHGALADGRDPDGRVVQPLEDRGSAAAGGGSSSRRSWEWPSLSSPGAAEIRRVPFDLPESESSLVAGYHTEYSGIKFGMFFVGEYLGVTLMSLMIATLFFGGWLGPAPIPPFIWLAIKTFIFILFFILLRASLPRPRVDQLMTLGWKVLLPLSLLNLVVDRWGAAGVGVRKSVITNGTKLANDTKDFFATDKHR